MAAWVLGLALAAGLPGDWPAPKPDRIWLIGGRLQMATLAPRGVDSRRFEVVLKERLGRLHAQACVFADVKDVRWNGSCFPLQTEKLGTDFVARITSEPDLPAYASQAQRLLRALIIAGNAVLRPQREIIGYDLTAPLEVVGERAPSNDGLTTQR